jgi:hypothetical protein
VDSLSVASRRLISLTERVEQTGLYIRLHKPGGKGHNQKRHGARGKMGVFDPNNPPVSDNPITALVVGKQIMYDTTAYSHANAAEHLKVDLSKITAGGFIVDGQYAKSQSHAVKIGERARARKRVQEKLAARKAQFAKVKKK